MSGNRTGNGYTVLLAANLMLASSALFAQNELPGDKPSIYTCVDGQGRRITSDRPIPECMSREQRELSATGGLKRTIKPVPTADERARENARQKEESAKLTQIEDERRKNRALMSRYPNQASHDKARAEALETFDIQSVSIRKRQAELEKQREGINAELEFYKNDPSKAPLWLKKKQEENNRQREVQAQLLVQQQQEKTRLNTRFDEELARLRELWKQEGR